MTIKSKEFYEMTENFDKNFSHLRLDKENKENWAQGQVYQNGETNNMFKAFQHGYELARANYMN